jgi:hypothetical protein
MSYFIIPLVVSAFILLPATSGELYTSRGSAPRPFPASSPVGISKLLSLHFSPSFLQHWACTLYDKELGTVQYTL